jgi:nucleoside-diphosphate-sugar epimerase
MCKMVAYLEKIDYIHTRLSVPLDSGLTKGGYISSVLLKIKEGKAYERPKNNQLFDIILLEDVVHAYYLIGLKGKNKSDYFIGTSQYRTLNQYFELFENYKKGNYFREEKEKSSIEKNEIFSIEDLVNDTGFSLSVSFECLYENSYLVMERAIVTGATGFIGSYFVNFLIREKVEVLALGRKDFKDISSERKAKLMGCQIFKG